MPACHLHSAAFDAASDTADLPREQKLALLKQLRKALKQMNAQLQRAEAGPGSQVQLVDIQKAAVGMFSTVYNVDHKRVIALSNYRYFLRKLMLVKCWNRHRHQQVPLL